MDATDHSVFNARVAGPAPLDVGMILEAGAACLLWL